MLLENHSEIHEVLQTITMSEDLPRLPGRPPKAERSKRISSALKRYYDASPQKLDALAEAMHNQAMAGDVSAFTAIRDTMDGKPPQAIVGDDEHPPVLGYREWLSWMVGVRIGGEPVAQSQLSNDINMKRSLGEGDAQSVEALPAPTDGQES